MCNGGSHKQALESPCRGGSSGRRGGCLYRLDVDPTEHTDLAPSHPKLLATMLAELQRHNRSVWSPDRGSWDPAACAAALTTWGGTWGPWVP